MRLCQMATVSECRSRWLRVLDLNLTLDSVASEYEIQLAECPFPFWNPELYSFGRMSITQPLCGKDPGRPYARDEQKTLNRSIAVLSNHEGACAGCAV